MPQFPIKKADINGKIVTITDKSLIKHIVSVLRLKTNDELLLLDESEIAYTTKILNTDKNNISAEILSSAPSKRKLNFRLDLAQCVLKSGAMEVVVQKITELGVKNFYAVPSFRSVPRYSSKDIKAKVEKWLKICDESCKQCERADKPDVHYLNKFENLSELAKSYDLVIACVERSSDKTLKDVLKKAQNHEKVLIIVGPEGGFETREIEFFKGNKFECVSISNLIYRAETASISALSGVIYEYEL